MQFNLEQLENRGIEVRIEDNTLIIQGVMPMPESVRKGVKAIVKGMDFSGREEDELLDHLVDVKLWSTLKSMTQ